MSTTDAIKAGKHWKIDQWPRLKHAALALALQETQPRPEHRDAAKIHRIVTRWNIAGAFAFYSQHPELFNA